MSSAPATVLVSGLGSLDGLICDQEGTLYAAQPRTGTILRISPAGKVSEHLRIEGRPVGCAFDPDGGLLIVDEQRAAIWHMTESGGLRVAADRFDRRVFWGPNDVAVEPDGGFYLTDAMGSKLDYRVGVVYHVAPDRAVRRVADQLAGPTGITFNAAGDALVLAEGLTNRLMYLQRSADATLGEPQPFCLLPAVGRGPDGICFDQQDRLYVAVRGSGRVLVLDNAGYVCEQLEIGQPDPCSVCFGGPDRCRLYVADGTTGSISYVDRDVPGLRAVAQSDRLSLSPTVSSSGWAWRKWLDASESDSAN
jgi:gluconolactonase